MQIQLCCILYNPTTDSAVEKHRDDITADTTTGLYSVSVPVQCTLYLYNVVNIQDSVWSQVLSIC